MFGRSLVNLFFICSKEIAESGPLLATLAMDPGLMVQPPAPPMNLPEETEMEIKASDPVTQAVVDNIIGKLPTTKEQVMDFLS